MCSDLISSQGHKDRLTAGTRTSRLARWQTDYVIELLEQAWPGLTCHAQPFVTRGDKNRDKPLPEIGGKGLFTAELEQALREGVIDFAVHSLKDLPVENSPGLTIGAIPARADVRDGFVARNNHTLETLPPGSVVGTSSLRRQAQLLAIRPDLRVKSIRGNVGTRVKKTRNGDYDAAVLAAAGLCRLQMENVVSCWLTLDVMLPAPGQGALAVQCRADDEKTLELLAALEDSAVRRATDAERHFLQALGGGCSAPIAAFAEVDEDDTLKMFGLIAAADGSQVIRVSGQRREPFELAERLAAEALERGAGNILAKVARYSSTQEKPLPLKGKRVVVTRARPQAPELAERLADLGAEPVLFPTIRITPVTNTSRLDDAIRSLQEYDWVIFTSVNGVSIFWERLEALGLDVAQFEGVKVGTIGPATGQALMEQGVEPDFIPDEFIAERIAEGLGDVSGLSILLPRAELARATLAEMLAEQGAKVAEIASYRTLPAEPSPEALAELENVDAITFTSSSTVRNFVNLAGGQEEALRLLRRVRTACIGPITASTLAELGITADVVAEAYTIDGLIEALLRYYMKGA